MNEKELRNHVLAPSQAARLDMPELAWQVVQVEFKEPHEKSRHTQDLPVAKNIYHNGRRISGSLELTCKNWEERREWETLMAKLAKSQSSEFETELDNLLHTPVFIRYDGGKSHLAILMRDDQQDAWMGGLRNEDAFYTHQVVLIDGQEDVYPTIHVVQAEREVV